MTLILLSILLACPVLVYGMLVAHVCQGRKIDEQDKWMGIGISLTYGLLFGPLAVFAAWTVTNFPKHGLRFK